MIVVNFFCIGLGTIELPDEDISMVARIRTNIVEKRFANKPSECPEWRPTHVTDITLASQEFWYCSQQKFNASHIQLTVRLLLQDETELLSPWLDHELTPKHSSQDLRTRYPHHLLR